MNLIKLFVHNPVKVTVGVILLLMFGILAMLSMPMQLTPEVQVPTLTIQTTWPGASPQEVEREIIQEQEEHLKSVEGVRKISSESMDSLGQVTLEFPVGTDMREALLKVNTKLAQVPSYPEDANEPVINTSNAADRPIAWFILGERVPSHEEGTAFAAKHPELPEDVRDWLERGRVRAIRQTSNAAVEVAASNADESIGLALQAARQARALRESLSEPLASSLDIYDPALASATRELLDRVQVLAVQVEQAATLRGLDLYGATGEQVEMSTKFFNVVGNAPRQRMTVRQPAVVRKRNDGTIGAVVTKGLVD